MTSRRHPAGISDRSVRECRKEGGSTPELIIVFLNGGNKSRHRCDLHGRLLQERSVFYDTYVVCVMSIFRLRGHENRIRVRVRRSDQEVPDFMRNDS